MDTIGQCKYCNKETLIKCEECSQTFCNDISGGKSHIIYHLVKSKHKSISILLHKIQCVLCNESNAFRLGLLEKETDLIKLVKNLSLKRCNVEYITENMYCGHCKDLPRIISDKQLTVYPSEECSIELKDIKEVDSSSKIRLYFTPETYLNTFNPLMKAESLKEREIKEQMKQENATLQIEKGYCKFTVQRAGGDFKVNVGDELKFVHNSKTAFKGYICEEQVNDNIRVKIDLDSLHSRTPATLATSGYTIEFKWNPTTYFRMKNALKSIYKERKTHTVFNYILRGFKETMGEIEVYQPVGFNKLNESQIIAVKAALTRTLTLIQGPPGTGKTVISAVIVYNLVKHFGKKVLVVAPTNIAADQLAIKINAAGLKVLRVMSKMREDVPSDVAFLCLHASTQAFPPELQAEARQKLLESADVICCTCSVAGGSELRGLEFSYVLIDEAVQSTEPLSLVPCIFNPEKLILVGDHKQLGPTILNKEIVKCGYKQSLFERLHKIGVQPYLLSVQYRMHPDLCSFPSEYFYGGLLKSGTPTSRVLDLPNNFFYVCDGKEDISQSRTSFYNKSEAVIVENIIRYLFKNGVLEQQIGVITPYEGQRSYVLSQVFGNEAGNLEIKNVDGFQGREKDFIIVSLVRSNLHQGIGFLGDKRRMNVTLTRAKHGLIIIGNPFTLYKNEVWADLLNWYDEKGMIYEGPLHSLRHLSLKSFNLNNSNEKEV